MESTFAPRSWTDRLSTAFAWILALSVLGFLTFGFLWWSRYPQRVLLAFFGERADAEILSTEAVRYASFPYEGIVHTAHFQTKEGEPCTFELSYDPLPSALTGVFEIDYLPAWPSIVLPLKDPPTSLFYLASAIFCGLISLLFFGLVSEKNALLRFVGRPGEWMIARLEQLWDRLGFDHSKDML